MKTLRRLLVLGLFAAAFVLAYRLAEANDLLVSVDLLALHTPPAQLWVVLVCALGVGAALATSLLVLEIARLGLLARRYRKTIASLESEIHQLRNLPIAGDEDAPQGAAAAGPRGTRG